MLITDFMRSWNVSFVNNGQAMLEPKPLKNNLWIYGLKDLGTGVRLEPKPPKNKAQRKAVTFTQIQNGSQKKWRQISSMYKNRR